jgi:hypothetical protein
VVRAIIYLAHVSFVTGGICTKGDDLSVNLPAPGYGDLRLAGVW